MSTNTDGIYKTWRIYRTLINDKKRLAYYDQKLKDGHDVQCKPLAEVFSKDEIRLIRRCVRPEKNMCFKNAFNLVSLFPDRVKYVEGEVGICEGQLGIEHAWNLVDGKHYVDITFEMVLHEDVTTQPYVALGEYDVDVIRDIAWRTEVYGGVYDALYMRKHFKKSKK